MWKLIYLFVSLAYAGSSYTEKGTYRYIGKVFVEEDSTAWINLNSGTLSTCRAYFKSNGVLGHTAKATNFMQDLVLEVTKSGMLCSFDFKLKSSKLYTFTDSFRPKFNTLIAL